MKNSIKAMFFDIDGTLVSFKTHEVPESTKRALKLAKEEGILLFTATGRHKLEVEKNSALEGLGFTGNITVNGQYCYNADRVIYHRPIDPEDIRLMVEYLEKHPFPCVFEEADRMYINLIDEHVHMVQSYVNIEIPPCEDARRALEQDVYQLCVYLRDGKLPEVLEKMTHCSFTEWHYGGIDVVAKDGSKWIGVGKVMEYYGLEPQEIAAFGDADNDIEMLQGAGISVAMGNARSHVKKIADFVTDDVDSDGIWNAVQKILN